MREILANRIMRFARWLLSISDSDPVDANGGGHEEGANMSSSDVPAGSPEEPLHLTSEGVAGDDESMPAPDALKDEPGEPSPEIEPEEPYEIEIRLFVGRFSRQFR